MSTVYEAATNIHPPMATKDYPKRKRSASSRSRGTISSGQTKRLKASLNSDASLPVQNDSPLADASSASAELRQSRNASASESDEEKLERIATTLVKVHAGLTKCKKSTGLSPSPEVNQHFTRLVVTGIEIVSEALESAILTDGRVKAVRDDLRKYASDGEGLMEAFYAKNIIRELERSLETMPDLSHKRKWEALQIFPYYQNYIELTRMEKSIIESLFDINKPPQTYVFIGSGPMPLTAICLAYLMELERPNVASMLRQNLNPFDQIPSDSSTLTPPSVRIHNIDCDDEAISLSTTLAKKIGGPLRCLTFECRTAESTPVNAGDKISYRQKAYDQFDVVYLAALVGSTLEKKMEITKEVLSNMKEGSVLILRSAHNLRKLLYEPVELARLAQVRTDEGLGLNVVRVVHPTDEVVNSVVVCRVINTNKRK